MKENTLQACWTEFNSRVGDIENKCPNAGRYGICESVLDLDLQQFDEDTRTSHFVGLEVSSFDRMPEGMTSKILQGGKYAVFTHKGKIDSLRMTYEYIWGTWFICSGVEVDQREDFELYTERFLGVEHEQSVIEIYIPIK